jgi:hypothetical protein
MRKNLYLSTLAGSCQKVCLSNCTCILLHFSKIGVLNMPSSRRDPKGQGSHEYFLMYGPLHISVAFYVEKRLIRLLASKGSLTELTDIPANYPHDTAGDIAPHLFVGAKILQTRGLNEYY